MGNETVARHSFIGCGPYMVLSGKNHSYELRTGRGDDLSRQPVESSRETLRASQIPTPEGFRHFLVGQSSV